LSATDSLAKLDPEHAIAYVRTVPVAPLPPPVTERGVLGWLRANFFATPLDAVLTILALLLLAWIIPPFLRCMVFDATWSGVDREACLATPDRPEVGACWAFVRDRFAYFIYGSYPIAERWRVDIFFAMLALGIVWLLKLDAPRRDLGAFYFFVVVPIVSYVLLNGMQAIGLPRVDTIWATPVKSTTGYAFAGLFYFACCYMMSRYAKNVEVRLARADKR
jgi:general L-amino acid transport system permease protein